jgi:hypothetical protein
MKALLKAIHSTLRRSGGLGGLVTAVFAGRASAAAEMPYLVWFVRGGGDVRRDTGGRTLERVTLRFEVYGRGAAEVLDAIETAEQLFVGAPPTLESGALIHVRKRRAGVAPERRVDAEGETVFRARLDLEFLIERE